VIEEWQSVSQPRKFPRLLDAWREANGEGFTPLSYLNQPDDAVPFVIAAQWLFVPDFKEYRGGIFRTELPQGLTEDTRAILDRWFDELGSLSSWLMRQADISRSRHLNSCGSNSTLLQLNCWPHCSRRLMLPAGQVGPSVLISLTFLSKPKQKWSTNFSGSGNRDSLRQFRSSATSNSRPSLGAHATRTSREFPPRLHVSSLVVGNHTRPQVKQGGPDVPAYEPGSARRRA
jgi:hypothetical protein